MRSKSLQNDRAEDARYCWLFLNYLHRNLHTFPFVGPQANKTKTFFAIVKRLKISGAKAPCGFDPPPPALKITVSVVSLAGPLGPGSPVQATSPEVAISISTFLATVKNRTLGSSIPHSTYGTEKCDLAVQPVSDEPPPRLPGLFGVRSVNRQDSLQLCLKLTVLLQFARWRVGGVNVISGYF